MTLLEQLCPAAILVPHEQDWNSRHIAAHRLVISALQAMPADFHCVVVESEFWAAMDRPNLMVAGEVEQIADLVAATSFHVKEVERNPYHRLLPAWMMDNVRRGGELVGGQGRVAPAYLFATLYRLQRWRDGRLQPLLDQGTFVGLDCNAGEVIHRDSCTNSSAFPSP